MKDFKYKYEHLSYEEFFNEMMKVGKNTQQKRLARAIIYEDDFNDLSFDMLVDMKILLKQFKPLKDDLKNKVSQWKEAIQIAIDNKP
tara:strand:- start:1115 stop:1375 length:261 start_codon:yes stop_codon:yes gene_type:complete